MILRHATPKDAAQIAAIWTHYIDHTIATFTTQRHDAATIRKLIRLKADEGHGMFCAEHGTDIIGFATYGAFRSGPGYAQTKEHTVMVHPDLGVKGTGGALMRLLETHAKQGGAHSLFAGVSGENTNGIAFHCALGFQTVTILREVGFKFDRYHDLVLMQKFL